jgi:nicotine blue oxidoreductase
VAGIVLAAGAGTRMGRPKGLMRTPDGTPWVSKAVAALAVGGCDPIYLVTGAQAEQVQALAPAAAEIVHAGDWSQGLGASLRAGLRAVQFRAAAPGRPVGTAQNGVARSTVVAVVITLVDTLGVTPDVVARLALEARPGVLARAGYHGVPGHPVLIGRDHWVGVIDSAAGDAGARAYLSGHDVTLVEASDVGSGEDYDTPDDLP